MSWAMSVNCYDALTAEELAKLGGGKSVEELERVHSKSRITKPQTAWLGLLIGANYPPLLDAILDASSPWEAWTVILAWYSLNDEATKYRTLRAFEELAMVDQESADEYFSRAHLIVMKMREMRIPKTNIETNCCILRCLSSKHELVELVLMMRDSLTRAFLDRMVLETFHEMEWKKGGKEERWTNSHAMIDSGERVVMGGDDGGMGWGRHQRNGWGNRGSGQQQQQYLRRQYQQL